MPAFLLIAIRSKNGCIFGGFTKVAWSSSGADKVETSAFLFTLKIPHGIPPTYYPIRDRCIFFAVCHDPFNAEGSRSFFHTHTYEDLTGKAKNTFTGNSRFICDDVEVFIPI